MHPACAGQKHTLHRHTDLFANLSAARRSWGPSGSCAHPCGKEARTRGFASLALARFAFSGGRPDSSRWKRETFIYSILDRFCRSRDLNPDALRPGILSQSESNCGQDLTVPNYNGISHFPAPFVLSSTVDSWQLLSLSAPPVPHRGLPYRNAPYASRSLSTSPARLVAGHSRGPFPESAEVQALVEA